jgi:Ca-activated chloride channel family protein
VRPSRLIRSRQKIADLLRLRPEGFTALVAYAGNAHTVVPLTEDSRTIENLLPALSPDMMPVFGSNLGEAIEHARELFRNAGADQGLIVVVTDGIDRVADVTERRDNRFPISILGVGTEAGGTIPLDFANQPGQVLRTQQGEPIQAPLDPAGLAAVSARTYGRYRTLTIGDDDVMDLLATPLPDSAATRDVNRNFDQWADRGFWLALLLAPVLLLGFRRGVFAMVPLLMLPGPADASLWEDLWSRQDQQAYRALQEGAPEQAAALFADPAWHAVALYRSGEYERAAQAFDALGDSTEADYNLGNALARQGDYQGAIARYDAVLERDPEHADARFNRALLEKLLESGQSSASEQGQSEASRDGAAEQTEAAPRPDSGTDTSGQQADAEGGDPSSQRDEAAGSAHAEDETRESESQTAMRDTDRDALEQWLRRVPDDPGGLLRRKFQHETNQRLRRGEYRARDTEKIW